MLVLFVCSLITCIVIEMVISPPIRWPNSLCHYIPTTAKLALDVVRQHYAKFTEKRQMPVMSPFLFFNRKGGGYYDMNAGRASGFLSAWQRSMKKAIKNADLANSFTEHDLRAKVGSDQDSLEQTRQLLNHTSAAQTKKSSRRNGATVLPSKGFISLDK